MHGLAAQIELAGRSMKGQLKAGLARGRETHSSSSAASAAQYDAAVKNMNTGEQIELDGLDAGDYYDRIAERVLAEVKR